ncbi:hypothetical protein PUN28_004684 [Cardiocondyla obscurior]|uniref:Uncharacterized protein n=1 Tax=Cardiocondyla obscurior TaxID=286306 RepID=A0AAW2GGV4_9HYME
MHTAPSLRTDALEATDFVSTSRAIQARIRRAVIDIDFTGRSSVALATVADKSVVEIYAAVGADRTARIALTFIDFRLALQANEAGSAFANEALQLQARSLGTIIGVNFTALTFPSWQTVAFVTTLLKRYASRAVIARISASRARINLQKNKKKKKYVIKYLTFMGKMLFNRIKIYLTC